MIVNIKESGDLAFVKFRELNKRWKIILSYLSIG